MADFNQATRPLRVVLGDVPVDAVLITGLSGAEGISRLSTYTLDLVTPVDVPLNFADVLGKPTVVAIDQGVGDTRFYHGIVNRLIQGRRDSTFNFYRAELVPKLWRLTKVIRSRIFPSNASDSITVKDILKSVIGDLYNPIFRLDGTYKPRNICVQYRESDFAFISRLMEEEGMYYYFTHLQNATDLVISDNSGGHDLCPRTMPLKFQDESLERPNEGRIVRWDKAQELRAGNSELTDFSFQMPSTAIAANSTGTPSVPAGAVDHDLTLGGMDEAGTFDHPAGTVRWRDGVAPGGADRDDDLSPIFDDIGQSATVRVEQEQSGAVRISGTSTFTAMTAGHKFEMVEHFDADGSYALVSVNHAAKLGANVSDGIDFTYRNIFECLPLNLPFRPERVTPRPKVSGTQTAKVVGDDPDVDPDKFGRVKVSFRWDPDGPRGLESSCWVRVAQFWAGRAWGAQFIPRIDDEVVVAFLEGDPDQPIIIGSVYNADNMPIYKLPENKTQSGIKTHSIAGGTTQTFNEFRFEDKKGNELITIHAERNMSTTVEANENVNVGANSSTTVANNNTVRIGTDAKADPKTHGKSTTTIFGDTSTTITKGDYSLTVATGKSTIDVKAAATATYGDVWESTAKLGIKFESATKSIELIGAESIKMTSGASSMELKKDGTISIKGVKVSVEGSAEVTVNGAKVDVVASAIATLKGNPVKINC